MKKKKEKQNQISPLVSKAWTEVVSLFVMCLRGRNWGRRLSSNTQGSLCCLASVAVRCSVSFHLSQTISSQPPAYKK